MKTDALDRHITGNYGEDSIPAYDPIEPIAHCRFHLKTPALDEVIGQYCRRSEADAYADQWTADHHGLGYSLTYLPEPTDGETAPTYTAQIQVNGKWIDTDTFEDSRDASKLVEQWNKNHPGSARLVSDRELRDDEYDDTEDT